MSKPVRAYEVENLTKVDTTKYKNGDIFITGRSGGILINRKIIPFNNSQGLKKADVEKIVHDLLDNEINVKGGEGGA